MANDSKARPVSAHEPITVRVAREVAGGLIVLLPDGSEGLIRERELSWDGEERRRGARIFKPGERVEAVRLNRASDDRPELSIRLAQADPWITIERRYPVGSLTEGLVTGIMPYGAFIELELGITGLLHKSHLPPWAEGNPADLFWPGDSVKVIIDRVDARTQRISLSMANLSSQRWRNAPPRDARRGSPHPPAPTDEPLRSRLDVLFDRAPSIVLVIEDDPIQQVAITDWLRRAGQIAEAVTRVEDAVKLMETLHPTIVLMDVDLPEESGIDGMRRIKARWPGTRGVLMTDWSHAEQYAPDIHTLREAGVSLLIKPLVPEDLLGILLERPDSAAVEQSELPMAPSSLGQPKMDLVGTRKEGLAGPLARLLSATHADKAVLFEVDTDSRQVAVFEQKGVGALRSAAIPDLIHSPVRDAAEDGQVVIARSAQEAEGARFHYLTPLLSFSLCLGVPVPARIHKRYALFLFFAQPVAWPEGNLARAEGAAEVIGAWLERQQFIRQMASLHGVAVQGQMKRALAHEISGKLSIINLYLDQLEDQCYRMQLNAATSPKQVEQEAAHAFQTIKTLKQQADLIARTTRSLNRMSQMREEDIVVLEPLIGESLTILDDLAETGNVTVEVRPLAHLTFTRTNVTYLQQVLVNVLQNAIQHIHQLRPAQGGRVAIRVDHAERGGKPVLQLRVEDDGPGIHRRNWERIFDLDFTTRPEGSGLGLFLSRNLIQSQGGRLLVESSHMLWGTTFLIELPLHT